MNRFHVYRITFLVVAVAMSANAITTAESPAESTPTANPLAMLPADEAQQVLQWAADWVRQSLPSTYHGNKDWGKQTRLYGGVRLTKHDGNLSTKRRWIDVDHGRWIRYTIDLHDPTLPDRLSIQITKAEISADQRLQFEAQIDTWVDWSIQQERWNLGARLFSVSAKGEARLRMLVAGDVGFAFDLTRIPPDVIADPNIRSAGLSLVSLKVDRISKLGGDVADAFGDLAERILRDEYLPKQQTKITDKLNRQIDRRRDQFRFGASQWLMRTLPVQP